MPQLLFTTAAVRPHGAALPGVPMLIGDDMALIEPACAWLMHVALVRGRTRSAATWRTYGEALYDWWQTLTANGWAWDDVSARELAAYRDSMLNGTRSAPHRRYARATINQRLRVVAMFYAWAHGSNLVDRSPAEAVDAVRVRARPSMLAHVDASGGKRQALELTLRAAPRPPRVLETETLRRVMDRLSARDRLIATWALTTGMRRGEVAALPAAVVSVPASERFDAAPVQPVLLDVTKGGRPRYVYPPTPLVDRTRAYVREERAVAVRRAHARDVQYIEPAALFLTEHGHPITPRRVGAMFSSACQAAGVASSFHALRHTFATRALVLLQRQVERFPDLNPLLVVQTLLGHADLSTTGIYLELVACDLVAAEEVADAMYGLLAA
ncbi:MAG: tyrosine-type recombinase/integrase [Hyphomonadaceae bacterium]|nr:tyrosine-type recombinase/integrase [Hyphomonadaceae bacterium]